MAGVAYHADVLVARAPFAPHPRSRRATVFVAFGVALLALAALFVAGGTAGIVLAACIALLPLAIYLSAHAPLIFPFGLYVAVIPFDSILFVSGSGSTIARILGLLSAVALLIGTYHRRAVRPGWSWVGWLLAMLWISATALWTVDPHLTSQAVTQMLSLFGLFTVIAVYPASRRELYWLLAIVVMVGAGSALYGLYDHISVAHLASDNRVSFETQSGIFVDPNHYAANFLLPIAIAVAGLLFARSIGSRILFGAASATMAFGVLLSGSRGALISLAAVLLYLAIRTKRVREIAAVAGAGALLSLAYPLVWQRFLDPTQGDASGRFSVWKIAWAAAMDHFHWLFGAGFGAFPAIYDRVFLTVYEHDFTGWSRVGHNLIAQSVVETGIIGLALIAFAWYRTWRAPQVVPKGDGLYPWRIALEAATLGLFVTALSVDLLWFKYPWLCFSIAVLVRNVYVREHQRQGHFMHVHAATPAPSREADASRLQVIA
jgi:O-antigen ligase